MIERAEEIEDVAVTTRARLRLGDGPLSDIFPILRDAGLMVAARDFGKGFDGLYIRGEPGLVVLNASCFLPRLRFTAAHELGHHVLGHSSTADVNIFDDQSPAERDARMFAASFLMPRAKMHEYVGGRPADLDGHAIVRIAERLGVSYESAVYRIHNLGLISAAKRDRLLGERAAALSEKFREQRLATSLLPAEFTDSAVAAYANRRLSLGRLAELLEEDPARVADSLGDSLHPEDR